MNLAYYANYVTIVEEGSLTAAARKLRIAQPALSNQIKALAGLFLVTTLHWHRWGCSSSGWAGSDSTPAVSWLLAAKLTVWLSATSS